MSKAPQFNGFGTFENQQHPFPKLPDSSMTLVPDDPLVNTTHIPFGSPVLVSAPSFEFGTSCTAGTGSIVNHNQLQLVAVEAGEGSNPDNSDNVEDIPQSTFFDTPNGTRFWTPVVRTEFKPQVRMIFRSWDDVLAFYESYAEKSGFSIRKATLKKKNGVIKNRYLLCNKAGKPRKQEFDTINPSSFDVRQSSFSMCDCKACLKVKQVPGSTEFEVYGFVETHNHDLVPHYNHDFTKKRRRLDFSSQQFIHQMSVNKVGPSKAHRLQVSIKGGHHNVQGTPRDYKNFFRNIRMYIGDRDSQIVVEKLQARADHLPDFSFHYNIVHGELRSLFWADETAKINYKLFGDVIAFDATYHTNRYDMIFVPFTGVDSHKKCVTFGAGLLFNETVESYCWLLECFIKSHGRQPTLVLTDQDPAMRQAVSMVLDQSRHRLCMWHIMKKLPVKISGDLLQNTGIRAAIHKLVWSVYNKPSTFEQKWKELIDEFGLHENAWLSDMYALRESWVPCYFREIPMCCLMKTTSRCESSNAAFKVNSSHANTLVQFLLCFDTTIETQRYTQRMLQYKTNSTTPNLNTGTNIEKHAALVYTHAIFKEVSKEIQKGLLVCYITNVDQVDGVKVYTVSHLNKKGDLVNNFKVKVDMCTETFECSCMGFTRIGYLCRHIFCVFRPSKVEIIPDKYILDRWRRQALPGHIFHVEKRYGVEVNEHSILRNDVKEMVGKCLDRLRADHGELVKFSKKIRTLMDEVFKSLSQEPECNKNKNIVIADLTGLPNHVQVECRNPHGINNKGTRKNKRIVGPGEQAAERAKKVPRKCKACGEFVTDHDSRNCKKIKEAASSKK